MADTENASFTAEDLKGWLDRHLERQPKLPCRVADMTPREQQIHRDHVAYHTGFLLYLQQRLALATADAARGDVITVGRTLPSVAEVRPGEGLSVEVRWKDGRTETVDLSPVIGDFKVFRCLRDDRSLFETVRVGDHGRSIEWGDGIVDMAATTVERLAAVGAAGSERDWDADELRRGV